MFPWDDETMEDFDPTHTVQQLIRYTEDILCHATVETRPHPLLQHAAATFYELVRVNPRDLVIDVFTGYYGGEDILMSWQ